MLILHFACHHSLEQLCHPAIILSSIHTTFKSSIDVLFELKSDPAEYVKHFAVAMQAVQDS
jgi:hypothetical protein